MIVRPEYAGAEGVEPSIAVLETAVMPFNYAPSCFQLNNYTMRTAGEQFGYHNSLFCFNFF